MAHRYRVYRAEPGPRDVRMGLVFVKDDQGRSRYALVPRDVALTFKEQLDVNGRFVDWWTTTDARLVP